MENMTLIYLNTADGSNQAAIDNDHFTLHPADQTVPQQSSVPETNCLEPMVATDCDRSVLLYPTLYF